MILYVIYYMTRVSCPKRVLIANYEYDIPAEHWTYRIDVPGAKEYVLNVDSILLHLYNNGVGVISFHLNNRSEEQSSPQDILNINQFGRRVYPPFFAVEPDTVGTPYQYNPGGFEQGLRTVKGMELANKISLGPEGLFDDFARYTFEENLKEQLFIIPRFISGLFPGINLTHYKQTEEAGIHLSPILDDRMFVVCWYGNNKLAEGLQGWDKSKKQYPEGDYTYKWDEWWFKFIYVDGGQKTCQNEVLTKKLTEACTNDRWVGYGTLYGTTRYSLVCLTKSLKSLGNSAFLVNHMQTMYYKMAELALVQRACVLRFSDEVTEISSLKEPDVETLSAKVSSLYLQYIRFVNKIYFREVTTQEQGIELYDKLHQAMCLPKHVEDLDNEIAELHTYVSMLEERKRNRDLAMLTRIGAVFIVPSFIAGFLGMNIFDTEQPVSRASVLLIIAIMMMPLIIFYFFYGKKKQLNNKDVIFIIAVVLFYIITFAMSLFLFG